MRCTGHAALTIDHRNEFQRRGRAANRIRILAAAYCRDVHSALKVSKTQRSDTNITLSGTKNRISFGLQRWGLLTNHVENMAVLELVRWSFSAPASERAMRAEICASILESVQVIKLDTACGSCVRQSEKLKSLLITRARISISSFLRRRASTRNAKQQRLAIWARRRTFLVVSMTDYGVKRTYP